MVASAMESASSHGVADILAALVQGEGSGHHPFIQAKPFKAGADGARNLADAAHYLCTLHGRHPGVADLAAAKDGPAGARDWLEGAIAGFARERAYLTRIVVAAGPLPSTPGQAESEAAVIGQRHALEMLASSDRAGCALGAAMALVLDWRAIRLVLDGAARRFGVEPPVPLLPSADDTGDVATAVAINAGIERAIVFGAQQMLVQQRCLWDLLEARTQARHD